MEIMSNSQQQVLGFVAACNRNYHYPTSEQVTLWRDNPQPAEAVYKTTPRKTVDGAAAQATTVESAAARIVDSLSMDIVRQFDQSALRNVREWLRLSGAPRGFDRELVSPAETQIEHLVRIQWLTEVKSAADDAPGLSLTDLGRALLRDAETDAESEDDLGVVVLDRNDPLAYPILVGQLAAAGPALLVDPYLKLADLHMVVVSTQITRLMVSAKGGNKREVESMRAYLGSVSLGRRVEVRGSTALHDRVLSADDGSILTLGTSLNGVGRTTTVMSPVPSPAGQTLRDEYERLWSDADLIGPPDPPADDEVDEAESQHERSDEAPPA